MGIAKTILAFIGFLFLCMVIAAFVFGMDSSDTGTNNIEIENTGQEALTNNQESPSTEDEQKPEKVYSMNENIVVDYLSYKITKAETFNEMGVVVYNKETNGKFIKVYMDITNNAKETKNIFSPRFEIEDNQGRIYHRLSDDIIYIADYIEFGKQLQPGLTASGAIVFELPKDSSELKLVVSGDFLSVSEIKVDLSNIQDIGKDTTLKDEQDAMMEEVMQDY